MKSWTRFNHCAWVSESVKSKASSLGAAAIWRTALAHHTIRGKPHRKPASKQSKTEIFPLATPPRTAYLILENATEPMGA